MRAAPAAPGLRNWGLILLLGAIWGSAFMGVSLALEGIGPWWVTAGRVTLGGLALLALGAASGQPITALRSAAQWRFVIAIGLLAVATPFALLSWGLTLVPSAFAGVAMGSVPLLILPLVAIFSPEEAIGPRRVVGVALGFVGLVILIGQGALEEGSLAGRLACAGAAGCYAIGSVLTRRAPPMPPLAFATGTLLVAALALLPLAYLREGPPVAPGPGPLAALCYVALFPTALAGVMRVWVITSAGSLFMSLTSYMVPVWAVIFGVALLGEALPPQVFAALALILSGIAISQSGAFVRRRRS